MAPSAIAGAHGIAGHERADDDGDGGGRESDREDDQARHRRPVVPEISERRVVRRVEQYGGDEERQRQLGRERERRRDRNKREQRTAERQEHRIRCADAARRRRQDHGGDEETEKLFEFPHISRCCDATSPPLPDRIEPPYGVPDRW